MPDPLPSAYRILTAASLPAYLATLPGIPARLGGAPSAWQVRDVADGNLNAVFLVDGPEGGLCVKQALPYVRVVGESWPMDIHRAFFEARYIARVAPFAAGLAPRLHHYDDAQFVMVMDKLAPHTILRRALLEGRHMPRAAADLADYAARASFHTSDLAQPFERRFEDLLVFSRSLALQRITVDLVFTDPFAEHERNRFPRPHLTAWAAALREDAAVKDAVATLRRAYLGKPQSLIHGDLHSGSVMVTPEETRVIDGEFACVGPSGFDIGHVLAHFALAWFARPQGDPLRPLLAADMAVFWDSFRRRFLALWEGAEATGDAFPASHYPGPAGAARMARQRAAYLDDIFADARGFLAVEIIRRIIGFAQVADFQARAGEEERASAMASALAFARSLLVWPERYGDIADLTAALPRFDGAGLDPRPTRPW
ncbi:S-methyl-5-thioribose kinase [Roseomonas sp. GC11]|uniref:S-methyl-5-thioribose kinase n=1 Tax=Roseomonas sp. GC11 TaxID=2950546 RepID=UPI0021092CA4|nr:S-methyl-5-thioribose kinase [Roseomonas sp. GC11]MCQ4161626.1 S-methyl-5-thioribose kinase [Roseomonas sp. GC11]